MSEQVNETQKLEDEAEQLKAQMANLQGQLKNILLENELLDTMCAENAKVVFQIRKQNMHQAKSLQAKDKMMESLNARLKRQEEAIASNEKIIAEKDAKINELTVLDDLNPNQEVTECAPCDAVQGE